MAACCSQETWAGALLVVCVIHMLSMHKRMLCEGAGGAKLDGQAGDLGIFECLAALPSAVQHSGAHCKWVKAAWKSLLKMPCDVQCTASLQQHT